MLAKRTKAEVAAENAVIVIDRPAYGEQVYLVAPSGTRWTAWRQYVARARAWWSGAAEQLALLSPLGADERRAREIAEFELTQRSWALDGVAIPALVRVSFEVPDGDAGGDGTRRNSLTPVVRGNSYTLSATLGRRAIAFAIAGATERGERWHDEGNNPIVMREGATTAEVVLVRPLGMMKNRLSERDAADLAEAHRRWREIDQDVIDALVNNVRVNGYDERGRAFASYDAILDARGLNKKTKRETSGKRYTAGHRLEDREEIHRSVLRLVNMGAAISDVQRKGRRATMPAVIVAHSYEFDTESGAPTGVWYELGAWTEALNLRSDPLVPLAILGYDPYRQSMERRLGRLLSMFLAASPTGSTTHTISELLNEVHANLGGPNKGRIIERVEKALNQLKKDRVIGAWRLDPDVSEKPLPGRGVLEDWLARRLVVQRGIQAALRR